MAYWLWLRIGLGVGTDFQVVRVGDRVTIRGRIAKSKLGRMREFFLRDVAEAPAFAVAGTINRRRSIRLRWAGEVSSFTRQRVRNYLVELLR